MIAVAAAARVRLLNLVSSQAELDLILRVTALLVLLHARTSAGLNALLRIECLVVLAFPGLLTNPRMWILLTATLLIGNVPQWSTIDNHQYLIGYWVLACALALRSAAPMAYLRVSARALVAAVFGFAVLWKVLAGEYLDGTFFYWTFFMDARLSRIAALLAGQSVTDITTAAGALRMFGEWGADGTTVGVRQVPGVWTAAIVAAWLGLTLEAGVAVSHLLPRVSMYRIRHLLLSVFVGCTYFFLPVVGFAFVLTVLGMAECGGHDLRRRARYVVLLLLIQLTTVPWQALLVATE